MDNYFILWVITQYYVIYFVAQIVPALSVTLVSLKTCPHIVCACVLCKHLLIFLHYKMLQVYLVRPLPRSWNQPWFLYWRQELDSGCAFATVMSLLLGHLSWQSKDKICVLNSFLMAGSHFKDVVFLYSVWSRQWHLFFWNFLLHIVCFFPDAVFCLIVLIFFAMWPWAVCSDSRWE